DDVAPPCPGCTRRLARSRELFSPLRLDPGTHVRTVRLADVVAARSLAKPAALEQRADDVASVPDDVEDRRLGVGADGRPDDEAQLGRLLDGPQVADEGEPPDPLERRAELP